MLKKEYTFTGKYKINNKNEAFFTNSQFIDETVIPVLKQLKLKKSLPSKLMFLDTSAGDNRLALKLKQNSIIDDYVGYDISFNGEMVFQKDWLREKSQKEFNFIGFNPPYGFNSNLAKKFIEKSYNDNYEYCIWLVPITLKKLLNKLYISIHEKDFIGLSFENNKKSTHIKSIKNSVTLFVGKRREKKIILSKPKNKKLNLNGIVVDRGHYKGISDDTDIIVKKTGNPVLLPFFVKQEDNTWIQYGKDGVVTENAELIKKEKGYYMRGISTTKHTRKEYDYSVDSNVYFKVKNVRDALNIDVFKNALLKKSGEKTFFELTNRYKPASITKGWFEEFIFKQLTK
tara:strand:+ start:42156 stop:43184 length:1029 start_codon:yes stop_codon:yes gene_type:complete